MKIATTAAAIVLLSTIGASAQTSTTAPAAHPTPPSATAAAPNSSPGSNSAANEPMRQQVRDNLAKAGFTDIHIMPTSFMVRAKDQSGNPVMMVINPDSFTEITEIPKNGTAGSQNNAPPANVGSTTGNTGTAKH